MKKLITLFLAISLFSCNDGDFDVPAFEFSSDIKHCGEYLLYITNSNSTEVLILTLSSTQLGTEVGEEPYDISSSLSAHYRIFDDGISNNYFCQDIPPSNPKVLREMNAESGTINITTAEILENEVVTGYEYTITISNLLFDDDSGTIFFESLDFGIFNVTL